MGFAQARVPLQKTSVAPQARDLSSPTRAPRPSSKSAGGFALARDFGSIPVRAPGHDAGSSAGAAGGATVSAGPATAGAIMGQSVQIYPISLPGSSRSAATDVAQANRVWAQCSIGVTMVGGESWNTNVMDILDPKAVLNEYPNPSNPTIEETTMLQHHPGGSALHVYFVPSMSAGSRGESFWPSMTPSHPAVVVSDSAAVDTFAHELGHVLLDDGGHHSDPDNLMASGSIRNVGVDKLTPQQCARARVP
jgi:hypothetical protein